MYSGVKIIKSENQDNEKYPHYFKPCPYSHIDVYRVLDMFEVTHPALQHAVKKLLVAGGRGHKDILKDVIEAMHSCARFIEMEKEDNE